MGPLTRLLGAALLTQHEKVRRWPPLAWERRTAGSPPTGARAHAGLYVRGACAAVCGKPPDTHTSGGRHCTVYALTNLAATRGRIAACPTARRVPQSINRETGLGSKTHLDSGPLTRWSDRWRLLWRRPWLLEKGARPGHRGHIMYQVLAAMAYKQPRHRQRSGVSVLGNQFSVSVGCQTASRGT